MKNRMLTAMTVLCMMAAPVCGTLSEVMQSAVTANAAESGKCGENLTWALDADGTLTISGTGKMDSKPFSSDFRKTIKEIVINNFPTIDLRYVEKNRKFLMVSVRNALKK